MLPSWKPWIPNRRLGAAILLGAGTLTALFAVGRFHGPLFHSLAALCRGDRRLRGVVDLLAPISKAFRAAGLTQPANVVLKNLQQNEETLRRQQAELQRLYTVAQAATEAKSNFLANMSHEIRTPMTAILGFTNVLAGNLAGSGQEESREAVAIIKKNGEYLLTLLNDILDLSKIEAGKLDVQRVPCSPCQLVADVASLMRVRAEAKGLALSVEFAGPMPETIVTDPVRLRQILVNLVGNAVKFTEVGEVAPEGGHGRRRSKPADLADRRDRHGHRTAERADRPPLPAVFAGRRGDESEGRGDGPGPGDQQAFGQHPRRRHPRPQPPRPGKHIFAAHRRRLARRSPHVGAARRSGQPLAAGSPAALPAAGPPRLPHPPG